MRKISLLLALAALPGPASAFKLKTDHSGAEVRWDQGPIVFRMPASAPAKVDAAELRQAIEASVSSWAAASGLDLRVEEGAPDARVGCVAAGENHNDILLADGTWDYERNALAATLICLDVARHAIVDADVVINVAHGRFKKLPDDSHPGGIYHDLQNTITHELGHALGLMHSEVPEACMYGMTRAGEVSKRRLTEDDVAGVRALYRADAQPQPSVGCSAAGALPPTGFLSLLALSVCRRRAR